MAVQKCSGFLHGLVIVDGFNHSRLLADMAIRIQDIETIGVHVSRPDESNQGKRINIPIGVSGNTPLDSTHALHRAVPSND
jgi:hypothetical protein